jgi:uncharacterized iron-regulated protein
LALVDIIRRKLRQLGIGEPKTVRSARERLRKSYSAYGGQILEITEQLGSAGEVKVLTATVSAIEESVEHLSSAETDALEADARELPFFSRPFWEQYCKIGRRPTLIGPSKRGINQPIGAASLLRLLCGCRAAVRSSVVGTHFLRANSKARSAALVSIALLLSSCVLGSRNNTPAGPPRLTDALREANGRYEVNRPLLDFYDTVWVLTRAGESAPRPVTVAEAAETLAGFDVVFYGESHGHAGVHLEQMKLLRELYGRDPRWVLSLEQFERDVQAVLDDYLAGRIGEATLIDKGRAWPNYATSYRPLVVFAKEHHLPVVAAEAPGWAVACVGQWGPDILGQFTPLERTWVAAELHVMPGAYRDKYMKFLGTSPAHGSGAASTPDAAANAQRSFSAQALRDDTMAESIAGALQRHPGYKVLHVTGSFHSSQFLGTVERLRLRDPALKIAVIDPVEVEKPDAPGFAADTVSGGTVLQLIYPIPEDYVDGEDMGAMQAKMAHAHEANRCKYVLPKSPDPVPEGHLQMTPHGASVAVWRRPSDAS